jgi:hypothetical protein
LRWFAYNGRREDVLIAIDIQRSRARDTEPQVLDFGPALRRSAARNLT